VEELMPAFPSYADLFDDTLHPPNIKPAMEAWHQATIDLLGPEGTAAAANAKLGTLLSRIEVRTAASSVAVGDRGKLLTCSGTWTLTLPPVADAGAGFTVAVRSLSGTVTVAAAGAEQVDDAASVAMNSTQPAIATRLYVCTGTAWVSLLVPAADGVMQNQTDASGARLVRIFGSSGFFGIGASSGPTAIANLDDHAMPSGFFRTTAADTTGTWPPGQSAVAGVGVMLRSANTVAVQFWARANASNGLWMRRYNGAWSGWERPTPTLGTVSQTSGTPTGTIIEAGISAAGVYRRFACGKQECWRTDLSAASASTALGQVFRSADVGWTFPVAFAAGTTPVIDGGVDDPDCWLAHAAPSATAVTLRALAAVSKAGTLNMRGRATGRWFA
jgi:hypothetical protein